MLIILLYSLFAAITAIVYTDVLTDTGMILDFWSRFLHNHIKKEWILKPLVDCVYCVGGQLALWSGFFIWNDYKLLTHFLFIMTTLFIIHIYKLWQD
jgi:hypothetical protein